MEADALELDAKKVSKILETLASNDTKKNIEILKANFIARDAVWKKEASPYFLFLASPVEISGNDKVEKISMVRNQLVKQEDGSLRPQATENKIRRRSRLDFPFNRLS